MRLIFFNFYWICALPPTMQSIWIILYFSRECSVFRDFWISRKSYLNGHRWTKRSSDIHFAIFHFLLINHSVWEFCFWIDVDGMWREHHWFIFFEFSQYWLKICYIWNRFCVKENLSTCTIKHKLSKSFWLLWSSPGSCWFELFQKELQISLKNYLFYCTNPTIQYSNEMHLSNFLNVWRDLQMIRFALIRIFDTQCLWVEKLQQNSFFDWKKLYT